MSPKRMRIVIAESLGAKWYWASDEHTVFLTFDPRGADIVGDQTLKRHTSKPQAIGLGIPNWPEDLNACHEMEGSLSPEEQYEYHNHLFDILPCDENHGPAFEDGPDIMTASGFTMLHAGPAQRCEAYLKTKGKWENE